MVIMELILLNTYLWRKKSYKGIKNNQKSLYCGEQKLCGCSSMIQSQFDRIKQSITHTDDFKSLVFTWTLKGIT